MVRGATAADTAPIACPIITSTAILGGDCTFVARMHRGPPNHGAYGTCYAARQIRETREGLVL